MLSPTENIVLTVHSMKLTQRASHLAMNIARPLHSKSASSTDLSLVFSPHMLKFVAEICRKFHMSTANT